MKKWIYLTMLALVLLTLAVGGWIVQGIRSTARPRLVERTA